MRSLLLSLLVVVSAPSWAAPPDDVHLDVLARTTVPLHVGGRVQAELPHRVRVGIDAGWLPDAYLSAWPQAAAWRGDVAAVDLTTSPGLAAGLDIGWRPLARVGLIVDAGWRTVVLRGAERWTVPSPTPGFGAATREQQVGVVSLTHLVVVDIGYEHVVDERLVLRVDAGGAFTVGAGATSDAGLAGDAAASTAEVAAARYRTVVHTPTLSVSVGYRFF